MGVVGLDLQSRMMREPSKILILVSFPFHQAGSDSQVGTDFREEIVPEKVEFEFCMSNSQMMLCPTIVTVKTAIPIPTK